jgi:hypothetical protein
MSPTDSDPIRAQVDREIAAAQLEHAALQFAIIHAAIRQGETSEALLRARHVALEQAALAYTAAHAEPTASELLEEALEAVTYLDQQTYRLKMNSRLRNILDEFITSGLWDDVREYLSKPSA